MYARRCRGAMRAGVSRGRRARPVLVALGAATMACTTAMGGDPEDVGKWDKPKGTYGFDWDQVVLAEHAVHLSTGQILVWQDPNLNDPQLWDPDDGSFTAVAYSLHNIGCGGHAGLADGSILVVGGGGKTGGVLDQASIFSFGLTPWNEVESMADYRWYPTCTTLRDGRVLLTTGTDTGATGCAVTTPQVYDPDAVEPASSWETLDVTTLEIMRLYPFMFVVPGGNKVFFAGGSGGVGGANCEDCDDVMDECDSFVLDVDAETWTYVAEDPITTGRPAAVIYQTEPGPLGRVEVLKCGGGPGAGGLAVTAIIDVTDLTPPMPIWDSDPLWDMKEGRKRHNLVLLPDGTILAIGGVNGGGAVKDPELFIQDPLDTRWETMATAFFPHSIHSTAVLMADGKVLAAGGDEVGKAEVFSPPYLFKAGGGPALRPVIGFAPTVILYDTSFMVILSGISPGAADIDKVSLLRLASVTHTFDQDQRYVPLVFEVTAPDKLSVDAPDDGNKAPPGYYMLFLITDDGVPSVAKYVKLN